MGIRSHVIVGLALHRLTVHFNFLSLSIWIIVLTMNCELMMICSEFNDTNKRAAKDPKQHKKSLDSVLSLLLSLNG